MKRLILLIMLCLIPALAYAGQCIIGSDGYVKNYTFGVYCDGSGLSAGDIIRDFKTVSGKDNEKLIYVNGEIIGSGEFVTPKDPDKEKLLLLLDDLAIQAKIKAIK